VVQYNSRKKACQQSIAEKRTRFFQGTAVVIRPLFKEGQLGKI
jgi:hypothetical protein